MTHASNVLGTVQPIEAIAPIVRESGALFLVDAAQSAGVVPIDLKATPIDLLAFPGHKALYGPTGTGALYVGPRADGRCGLARGGHRRRLVEPRPSPTSFPIPRRRDAQRPRASPAWPPGVAWVAERGPDNLRRHEVDLLQRVVDWAESRRGLAGRGPMGPETHVGALSLIVPECSTPAGSRRDPRHQLRDRRPPRAALLPYIHRRLGTFPDGTLRLSPGPFTTEAEIDTFLHALTEITAGVVFECVAARRLDSGSGRLRGRSLGVGSGLLGHHRLRHRGGQERHDVLAAAPLKMDDDRGRSGLGVEHDLVRLLVLLRGPLVG